MSERVQEAICFAFVGAVIGGLIGAVLTIIFR